MAQHRNDPRVKEFMRQNPDVVERVAQRRDELASMDSTQLIALASAYDADLTKIRDMLIARIITLERQG